MNRFRDGFFEACAEAGINRVAASALLKAAQAAPPPQAQGRVPRVRKPSSAIDTLARRLAERDKALLRSELQAPAGQLGAQRSQPRSKMQ